MPKNKPEGAVIGNPDLCPVNNCAGCVGMPECRSVSLKKVEPADMKKVSQEILNREVNLFMGSVDNNQ